ncbi:adenylyl-sulfate kinase [Nocardioides sp.]|uniref:adenylyl-sulfate kinase n=1 Tax=Nocardioides sp. TaxID=35761 RepID=UPI002614C2C8|nr:adenylyl-sulfate kinase [Nocardioides sp.]
MSTPAVPQYCPSPRELDDLELLVAGAFSPVQAFNEPGSPITLTVSEDLADSELIELVDPEGLPLARVTKRADGAWAVASLGPAQFGPFRRLRLTPAQVRSAESGLAGRTFVPVTDALTDAQLDQVRGLGPVVLLALVGHGTPDLSPVALLRATLRVAEQLPEADVVAVPLASHDDPEIDHDLGVQVTTAYSAGDPVVGLVDAGEPLDLVADIVEADQPAPDRQGLVLFFTGLSGSGKSTLAQALMDRLLEQGTRTVTSLDGDVVRRNLSAGLTFSKADRETNIRRIGWVAAEISRHGGVAVVSPIAPFDETRQQVRAMVDEAGGAFFLVHVATPLEECERRDRKGLYAKARRGEIPEFTGISSPYEEPEDADVRVDTTGRTIDDALADVTAALAEAGYLDLRTAAPETDQEAPAAPETDQEAPAAPETEQRAPAAPETDQEAPAAPETDQEAPAAPETEQRAPASVDEVPAAQAPLKVLFVCTANICRSPYMELAARKLLAESSNPDAITFTSAGTHGFPSHEMDATMATALSEATGADHTAFRSRPLTRELVAEADLVVTAEASHRTFVLDDDPAAFRKVFTLGQLADALGQVEPGLDRAELLKSLGERRGTASPELDVSDPYRRGRTAAARCSEHIDSLLKIVVPTLAGSPTTDAGGDS